ncbi:MAG TPA: energy transducer TonB [Thermoanaerobaculia bacterium]|nr:energy transducer TonB [Thermoanaerobaculia bacterium]
MDDNIEFAVESEEPPAPGVSYAVIFSVVFHVLVAILLVRTYHPVASDDKPVPIARYVQLIKQNPKDFVEAPGRKTNDARVGALWSDANRHASAPKSTGDQPTLRPGDGRGMFTPPADQAAGRRPQASTPSTQPSTEDRGARTQDAPQLPADIANNDPSRIPAYRPSQASSMASNNVNWHDAIKEVGKVASLGGGQNLDLGKIGGGGEKGFVEQGPLSFETQWYDWGEYAQSMVSKIRINWYDNMPPLIRTGMKGVVTIRFTIQRNGTITDITILNSSTVPPYDFAAQKAIELSSPLNPLPKDFPNPSERVTCMFFYNQEPPNR